MHIHFQFLATGQKRSVPTIPRFRAFGHGKSATMAVHRLTLPLQMPPMTRNKRNMLKLRETAQTAYEDISPNWNMRSTITRPEQTGTHGIPAAFPVQVFISKIVQTQQSLLILLTVVRMSSGRRPCWSERAPVIGDARNCSSENSDPIRPENQEHMEINIFL